MKSQKYFDRLEDKLFDSNTPVKSLFEIAAEYPYENFRWTRIYHICPELYTTMTRFMHLFERSTGAWAGDLKHHPPREIDWNTMIDNGYDPIRDLYFIWTGLYYNDRWWKFGFSKYGRIVGAWPELAMALDYFQITLTEFLQHSEKARENYVAYNRRYSIPL